VGFEILSKTTGNNTFVGWLQGHKPLTQSWKKNTQCLEKVQEKVQLGYDALSTVISLVPAKRQTKLLGIPD
jgi:hypothetical protein